MQNMVQELLYQNQEAHQRQSNGSITNIFNGEKTRSRSPESASRMRQGIKSAGDVGSAVAAGDNFGGFATSPRLLNGIIKRR